MENLPALNDFEHLFKWRPSARRHCAAAEPLPERGSRATEVGVGAAPAQFGIAVAVQRLPGARERSPHPRDRCTTSNGAAGLGGLAFGNWLMRACSVRAAPPCSSLLHCHSAVQRCHCTAPIATVFTAPLPIPLVTVCHTQHCCTCLHYASYVTLG